MSNQPTVPPVGEGLDGVVEVLDARAARFIDPTAQLARLTGGGIWAEGPVYLPSESAVMYSDVRMNRAMQWSAAAGGSVWREPNDHTNGNTLDREGRIIHCEHGNRRLARTELDGTRVSVVDSYLGRRLNSPNDVVVKSDGSIWFTDPPYGIVLPDEGHPAPQEQDGCYVFRFDATTGELAVMSEAMLHPNGLAFSPHEDRLYVSDTSAFMVEGGFQHILVFDVVAGSSLAEPRVFKVMQAGLADGLRVDEHGNVWTSAGDGIHLIDADGVDLAVIHVPEITANCVFGGDDGRRLFIAASSSLYAIDTLVRGAGVAAAVGRGDLPA